MLRPLFLVLVIVLAVPACDSLPEALGPAQVGVIEAQRAVDELEASGQATPEEIADAREKLRIAQEALAKVADDESEAAGWLEVAAGFLASSTGQPWFYIAGVGLAGVIRERHKKKIAESNAIALAKSVQPAIDAAPESTKTRIRDLQKGQPGIGKIVAAARTAN